MGKGCHVVIHDVIHDDNKMGNLWATDQSAIRTNSQLAESTSGHWHPLCVNS